MFSTNVIKVTSPVKCLFQLYKKRTETAKKEYLKQLAAYRASLVSQVLNTHTHTDTDTPVKGARQHFETFFLVCCFKSSQIL